MTTGFGALSVDITADATRFNAGMRQAQATLTSTQARMNRALAAMERGFRSITAPLKSLLGGVFSIRGAFAALAGAAAGGGLVALTRRALDTADGIAKMADRVGIGTDALQQLQFVASQSGIGIEQLETGLRTLNQTIASQAAGKKTILGQLGIDARDAAGNVRPLREVLFDLADAFKRIGPQSSVGIKALTDAFGARSGTAFANALKNGSEGLRQMMDQAERLGLVLDEKLLRGAESASDALDRMRQIVGTNLTRVLLQLAPTVESLAVSFANGAPQIERWMNAITRFLFGAKALGASGLKEEIARVTAELDRLDRRIETAASGARDPGRAREQGLLARRALVAELLQLEQLLEDAERRADAASRLPPAVALPPGMDETKKQADRLREYIDGLRQAQEEAARLAGLEGAEREALGAILRAEALAREQVEQGLRRSAELTTEEIIAIRQHVEWKAREEEAERAANEAREEGRRLFEELRTPAEAYSDTVARLSDLLQAGAISQDTFNRAMRRARENFEQADEALNSSKAAADQLAMSFKSAFEAAVLGGGKIRDIFASLLQDIARMILQVFILKPLLEQIAALFSQIMGGSGGSGGGFLSSIFGSLLGFASGGSFQVGGSGGTDSQLVAFRATPGERVDVLTPGQQRQGEGGGVVVQVINNSSEKTSESRERTPDGRELIKVVIGEVAKEVSRPGSQMNRAIRDATGTRQPLAGR